jgi:hypothetical protein
MLVKVLLAGEASGRAVDQVGRTRAGSLYAYAAGDGGRLVCIVWLARGTADAYGTECVGGGHLGDLPDLSFRSVGTNQPGVVAGWAGVAIAAVRVTYDDGSRDVVTPVPSPVTDQLRFFAASNPPGRTPLLVEALEGDGRVAAKHRVRRPGG